MDTQAQNEGSSQKAILLVEDESLVADLLAAVLEEDGYSVVVSANGQDALKRLLHTNFDLIITDIMMPYVNGIELVRTMQNDPMYAGGSSTPVIFMSSIEIAPDSHGCTYNAFLRKPFEITGLLLMIKDALEE